ncbi:hypothetical protein ACSBR1_028910 [Camellia fascicularis]
MSPPISITVDCVGFDAHSLGNAVEDCASTPISTLFTAVGATTDAHFGASASTACVGMLPRCLNRLNTLFLSPRSLNRRSLPFPPKPEPPHHPFPPKPEPPNPPAKAVELKS